jgi:hypothetical protein
MPTRTAFDNALSQLKRGVSTGSGLTRFNLMTFEMTRRPEWLYRGKGRIPRGRLEFRDARPVTAADRALCQRLIDAYALATKSDEPSTTGMWAWIFDQRQHQLAKALDERDVEPLATLLGSMFRQEFMVGIAYGDLVRDAASRFGERIWWVKSLDGLVSLAEALGAVPAETPEQGELGQAFEDGVGNLVEAIEKQLGTSIDFPDVGNAYGIKAGAALVPPEWPEQIYAADRLTSAMAQHTTNDHSRVVEIGAGYGAMAYWVMKMRPNLGSYTIVDLPIVNVLQGYFLSKALGADRVSLHGESAAALSIAPNTSLDELAPCDVVVNKDSMPEMAEQAMLDYLAWARTNCSGIFFSYNQEARATFKGVEQNLVPAAVEQIGGFRRVRRDGSWVRRGYVEEIYVLD